MINKNFLEKVKKILERESKLIEIKKAKKIVFVGDTHGDLEVSEKVAKDYLKNDNKIVFLGDYVDRGPYSKENLDFLLKTKVDFLEQIFLLQGNHEGHHILKFSPADFWESLDKKEYQIYSLIVEKFPLVVITNNIIALHGVLPNCEKSDLQQIKLGSEEWWQITWGDFVEEPGKYLGEDLLTDRLQFGRDWFLEKMAKFKKKVLIRSHQPTSPLLMFDNQCVTIFSSSAYGKERTIAILDFEKEIKDGRDLEILRI
jgi:predicted phosphodiesterase